MFSSLGVMSIFSKSWCNLIKSRPTEILSNSSLLPKIPLRCLRCFNFENAPTLSLSTRKYFFPYVHGGWILCITNHLQFIYHYYRVFNLSIQCVSGFWCFLSLYSKINKQSLWKKLPWLQLSSKVILSKISPVSSCRNFADTTHILIKSTLVLTDGYFYSILNQTTCGYWVILIFATSWWYYSICLTLNRISWRKVVTKFWIKDA